MSATVRQVALLVVAALLAGWYFHDQSTETARLAEASHRLDVLVQDTIRTRLAATIAATRAAQAALEQDSAKADTLDESADEHASAAVTIVTGVAKLTVDTAMRLQLALAAEQVRRAVAAKDSEVALWRGQAELWRATALAKDSVITQINAALGEAIRERDGWRAQASPGLLKRAAQSIPFVIGYAILHRVHIAP